MELRLHQIKNDYGIRKFFTDENNIKALFAVDSYEAQKPIAKENIFKSLQ